MFRDSSAVEQVTVNHWVAGSIPARGATFKKAMLDKCLKSPSKLLLTIECFCLCFGIPTLLLLSYSRQMMFLALWAMAILTLILLRYDAKFNRRELWDIGSLTLKNISQTLIHFLPGALILICYTLYFEPDRWLSFPKNRPELWALVMLLYPLISVYPQELIYRTFFFNRYRSIFKQPWLMILFSGLAFGYVHILFQNWLAVGLSTIGGFIFAHNYHKKRSLLLVCIEHALYGCLIFTIGLGWYFFGGRVR